MRLVDCRLLVASLTLATLWRTSLMADCHQLMNSSESCDPDGSPPHGSSPQSTSKPPAPSRLKVPPGFVPTPPSKTAPSFSFKTRQANLLWPPGYSPPQTSLSTSPPASMSPPPPFVSTPTAPSSPRAPVGSPSGVMSSCLKKKKKSNKKKKTMQFTDSPMPSKVSPDMGGPITGATRKADTAPVGSSHSSIREALQAAIRSWWLSTRVLYAFFTPNLPYRRQQLHWLRSHRQQWPAITRRLAAALVHWRRVFYSLTLHCPSDWALSHVEVFACYVCKHRVPTAFWRVIEYRRHYRMYQEAQHVTSHCRQCKQSMRLSPEWLYETSPEYARASNTPQYDASKIPWASLSYAEAQQWLLFIHGNSRQPIRYPPADESVESEEVLFEDSFDSAFVGH